MEIQHTGTRCNEFRGCFFGSRPVWDKRGTHPELPMGFPSFTGRARLGTVPRAACATCAAHSPLPLRWFWQGSNGDAAGMRGCGTKPDGLVWTPRVAQSYRGKTILANKCDCISLEPWGDLATTPNESSPPAPGWLQPPQLLPPSAATFFPCNSWQPVLARGSWTLHKARGHVRASTRHARSPGHCGAVLMVCYRNLVRKRVLYMAGAIPEGWGWASGQPAACGMCQPCPGLLLSNPCQPRCQRERCKRNIDQDVT